MRSACKLRQFRQFHCRQALGEDVMLPLWFQCVLDEPRSRIATAASMSPPIQTNTRHIALPCRKSPFGE